jgi:hypothetical protein
VHVNRRERLAVLLRLLGLRGFERRLYRLEVGLIESRERMQIQLLSLLINAAVWSTVAVFGAAVVARAMRRKPGTGVGSSPAAPETRLPANASAAAVAP